MGEKESAGEEYSTMNKRVRISVNVVCVGIL